MNQDSVAGPSLALITMVDHSGATRVKTIPASRLDRVATVGVGFSYVFAVMAVDDEVLTSPGYDTPSGDMRLLPDTQAAVPIPNSEMIWAPGDLYDQDMDPMDWCPRIFLKGVIDRLDALGITAQAAYESEFTLTAGLNPAHDGPCYSIPALLDNEDFATELVATLEEAGLQVQQFHPEYAAGQYEVSIRHRDPVAAADSVVLFRLLTRRVARRHDLEVSFEPRPLPDIEVGNGMHLHLSLWQNDTNFLADRPLDETGGSAVAGILDHLSGIQAFLTPSLPSYERIKPHHWAGSYVCWGDENREAALRLIPGSAPSRPDSANLEVKVIDASANPYLAMSAVLLAALDGIDRKLVPPSPITVDPDSLTETEREREGIVRLPPDLETAIKQMDDDGLMAKEMAPNAYQAYRTVRQYEWDTYSQMDRDQMILAHRERY